MFKDILLYRVLGMPTPEQRAAVKSGEKTWTVFGKSRSRRSRIENSGSQAEDDNPWLVHDLEEGTDSDTAPRSSSPSSSGQPKTVPWEEHEETRQDSFLRVLVRGGVIVVLVMLVLTGLRSWFFDRDDQGPATAPVPAAATYPQAAASGIAERVARSYLTWDEENTGVRTERLALDLAPDALNDNAGWNQRGKQTVATAATVAVDVTDESTARVTVAALVTPWAKNGDKWTPGKEVWRSVEMPVVQTSERLIVPTMPALVGMPQPQPIDAAEPPDADSAATTASREDAEAFFEAYGTKPDVSALIAPGESLTGIGDESVKFANLREWTVYVGDDKTRSARALVTWQVGDTELTQPYDLTLVAVAQGDQSRWQIASVAGGNAGKELK